MPHLQPHAALVTYEQALRQLIEAVLSEQDGPDWLTKNFSEEKYADLQRKQGDEERTRGRRGHVRTSTNLLDFSELTDLSRIIEKRWNDGFSAAFGGVERKEILVLLRRFEGLRLPVAHPRELLPFEEDLLSGIAGDLRNRVTIYLSDMDPAGKHWPLVDSITDQFGNSGSGPEGHIHVPSSQTLHPGQTVDFHCTATDTQGRELSWFIQVGASRKTEVITGHDVRLRWVVGDEDVADPSILAVHMLTSATPYHRLGNLGDARALFTYRVLPPS